MNRLFRLIGQTLKPLATVLLSMITVSALAEDQWVSENGYFSVSYITETRIVPLNRIHEWVLKIKDTDGAPVTDATILAAGGMPSHNHGLPTSPEVVPGDTPGTYNLKGLRFHMMGYWEIYLTIETDELKDDLVISLEL